jgi:hypothetical protein
MMQIACIIASPWGMGSAAWRSPWGDSRATRYLRRCVAPEGREPLWKHCSNNRLRDAIFVLQCLAAGVGAEVNPERNA